MTIEKRGTRYRIKQMVDGQYYSITLDYKPTKKEAEQLIAEHIATERNNLPIKGSFEEYANKYVSTKQNVLKTPTIVKYNSIIKNMADWFKQKELSKITQEDVQILINEYVSTHSAKSTYDLHGFVASVFGLYRPNFILKTTLPPKQKKEEYEPSDNDIKAILNRAEGGRYDVIFNLLVYGLRRSEALAIDVQNDLFDRKKNTTTLRINKAMVVDENGDFYIRESNKTDESTRNIEISNELADKMIHQGYVFDGPPHMLNKALRRYQDQCGIEHFKLHKFRAYYASMMLSLGIPITFVETTGGWKHGSTALREAYTYSQKQQLIKQQTKGINYLEKTLK